MANATILAEPMYLAYAAEGGWADTQITKPAELIQIYPVVFDGKPTGDDLRALPDSCRVEMHKTGTYFFCVDSNYYGRSLARVNYQLNPFYLASAAVCSFYGDSFITGSLGNFEQYKYLYVYKQPDGRGFRIARCNTYVYLPENAWADIDSYAVSKVAPGDYVPFRNYVEPVIPGKAEGYSTIMYRGENIASLRSGQKAIIDAKKYEFDYDLEFVAGGGGEENLGALLKIWANYKPAIAVKAAIERPAVSTDIFSEVIQ